jgi:hypothetical protein
MRQAREALSSELQSGKAFIARFAVGDIHIVCWHAQFIMLAKSCQKNIPFIEGMLRRSYRAGGVSIAIDKYNATYLHRLVGHGYDRFKDLAGRYRCFLQGRPRYGDDAAKPFRDWWKFMFGVESEPKPESDNSRDLIKSMIDEFVCALEAAWIERERKRKRKRKPKPEPKPESKNNNCIDTTLPEYALVAETWAFSKEES